MPRVLVVDDDPKVNDLLARLLRRLGHEVLEATNGIQAMQLVAEEGPDLVITDILMPEMDGFEVIRSLRAQGIDTPVVAMSGGGVVEKDVLLGQGTAMGAVSTLRKPVDLGELTRVIEEALSDGPPA